MSPVPELRQISFATAITKSHSNPQSNHRIILTLADSRRRYLREGRQVIAAADTVVIIHETVVVQEVAHPRWIREINNLGPLFCEPVKLTTSR